MPLAEKTVFISYRRINAPWALAVFQHLTHHGFDVFFDFMGIASGDFEQVIIENIRSRAHFLVLLTPSALERCAEPGDWFRREIEEAMACRRNIVPLMLESFDFGAPGIASRLTGKLTLLKRYNGLSVPPEYFEAAMAKLKYKFLNVMLDAVPRPPSETAQSAALVQQTAAAKAPPVQEEELTPQDWFGRGYSATGVEEKLRGCGEAIRLEQDDADADTSHCQMKTEDQDDLRRAREAAGWHIRLQCEGPPCYRLSSAWITQSTLKVDAFQRVEVMSSRPKGLDPAHDIEMAALIAKAKNNVVRLSLFDGAARGLAVTEKHQTVERRLRRATRKWGLREHGCADRGDNPLDCGATCADLLDRYRRTTRN